MSDKIMTIRCTESIKKRLRDFEVHPRETDEDILKRLMEECKNVKRN